MGRRQNPDLQSKGILPQHKDESRDAAGDCGERVLTHKRMDHLQEFLQGMGYRDDDSDSTCQIIKEIR